MEKDTAYQAEATKQMYGLPARYEVRERIALGSKGVVLHAFDLQLRREVAFKIFNFETAEDRTAQERFLREAKSLAILDHPNIVKILNWGVTEKGQSFIVMELLSGESLAEALGKNKTMDSRRFYQIFSQVISALAQIHSVGIVHRNCQPGSIMLSQDNEAGCLVKIIDFGIIRKEAGKQANVPQLTTSYELLGSPEYMSPEQCRNGEASSLSDIYSLGCTMYECLSGKPPFHGATPAETMYQQMSVEPARLEFARKNSKSDRLAVVIDRCLKKDPQARPQSAKDVQCELDAIFTGGERELGLPGDKKASGIRLSKPVVISVLIACGIALATAAPFLNRPSSLPETEVVSSHAGLKSGRSLFTRIKQLKDEVNYWAHNPPRKGNSNDEKSLNALLDQAGKIIADARSQHADGARFACLQIRAELMDLVHSSLPDQIQNQREAFEMCGPGSGACQWSARALTELYLELPDLEKAEQAVAWISANPPEAKQTGKYMDIPDELWKWEGSGASTVENLMLGKIACRRGDFARAKSLFARAEQLEVENAEHFSCLVAMVEAEADCFWNMGRRTEALDRLRNVEEILCQQNPDILQNEITSDFIPIAERFSRFNDKGSAKKTISDGIALSRRANCPVQEQEKLNEALQRLTEKES